MSQLYAELQSQGLTTAQVDQFMRDAITVYLPRQEGLVIPLLSSRGVFTVEQDRD